MSVDGTVDIEDPGMVIKTSAYGGFDVQNDGTLNATGDSDEPVIFTSNYDSTLGDAVNDDDSSTGTPGDYTTAIRFEEPNDEGTATDIVKYVDFKYASAAISVGATGTLSVTDDQFTDNAGAFSADTSPWDSPVLGDLDCLYPYANEINLSNDWFGSGTGSGAPGESVDLSGYVDESIPEEYSDVLQPFADEVNNVYPIIGSISDNTIPYTVWSCEDVSIPITDVNTPDFPADSLTPALATSPLWTDSDLVE